MLNSCNLFLIYLFTYVIMENMNYPFEYLVILGEYYFGNCDIYIYIYIYIYKHGLYISEDLPGFDLRVDTDHLLPNYTASHRNWPQTLHTPL